MGLIEKVSDVSDTIILLSQEIWQKNLLWRVAHLLIYFYEQVYHQVEFELPLSRKEIAEYVGMTTENVIRTMSEFRQDKIISISGKTIEIRDMDALRSISNYG